MHVHLLLLNTMEIQPNTSLGFTTSNNNNQNINLELLLERPNSSSSSSMQAAGGDQHQQPRIFSCNYCQRKFYSSQALGGHQNAHKLERSLAKKSRQMSSMVHPHGGSSRGLGSFNGGYGASEVLYDHHQSSIRFEHTHHHVGRFDDNDNYEITGGYGRKDQHQIIGNFSLNQQGEGSSWSKSFRRENIQKDNQLDLSLKL